MMNEIFKLFLIFFKMSFITFGGGYSCLPIMEKELVENKKLITQEELLNKYAIAQMLPGLIVINVGILIGYKINKIFGSIAVTIGTIIPPFMIILSISSVLKNYMQIPYVTDAFSGIQIVVSVLILNVILSLLKNQVKNPKKIIVILISFILSFFMKISPIYIILLFIIISIIVTKYNNIKSSKNGEKR